MNFETEVTFKDRFISRVEAFIEKYNLILWCIASVICAVVFFIIFSGLVAAFFAVIGSGSGPPIRQYYVAAVEVDWDYAPSGMDLVRGINFSSSYSPISVQTGANRIGRVYRKAIYREFTDDTFTKQKTQAEVYTHLGILGPILHAEVGDRIKVTFMNNASFNFSMHPHGLFYYKDSEGAGYEDDLDNTGEVDIDRIGEGDSIAPGENYTYVWDVRHLVGPASGDLNSILWPYHSHVNVEGDTNAGLIGGIVVTKKGNLKKNNGVKVPKGVDREFLSLFKVFDENLSPYLEYNINRFTSVPSNINRTDPEFIESNLMYGINGLVYGNNLGIEIKSKKKSRWYLMSAASGTGVHTPNWHGIPVVNQHHRVDSVGLLPGNTKTVELKPESVNKGHWLFHSNTAEDSQKGMETTFDIF